MFERRKGVGYVYRTEDAVEFDVAVGWDLRAVFRDIAAEETIAELARPGGGAGLRASLGERVRRSFERRRAVLGQKLGEMLAGLALDSRVIPSTDDAVVLHVALLVRREEDNLLGHRLGAMDAAFAGRLTFRVVGPMPPHGFARSAAFMRTGAASRRAPRIVAPTPATSAEGVSG